MRVKVDTQSQSLVPIIQPEVFLLQFPRVPVEIRDQGFCSVMCILTALGSGFFSFFKIHA